MFTSIINVASGIIPNHLSPPSLSEGSSRASLDVWLVAVPVRVKGRHLSHTLLCAFDAETHIVLSHDLVLGSARLHEMVKVFEQACRAAALSPGDDVYLVADLPCPHGVLSAALRRSMFADTIVLSDVWMDRVDLAEVGVAIGRKVTAFIEFWKAETGQEACEAAIGDAIDQVLYWHHRTPSCTGEAPIERLARLRRPVTLAH